LENVRPTRWALLPLVFVCATVGLMVNGAVAQTDSSSGWWPFNHSTTSSQSTPVSSAQDDIALKTPAKAGVELYVAVANLYVQSGKYAEAEDQYQIALKKAPSDIRVLLGYAILKDQINQPQEAMKLYQRAKEKHPKDASVYNNLAVHYARWDMNREAIEAARRAVELRPAEPRYRNNLAALLVETGLPQEAYKELRAVYDEPVAHYNLGFLLHKRGLSAAALQEFTIALELNPRMALAREWVERISLERGATGPAVVGRMPMLPPTVPQVAPNPSPSYPQAELPPPAPSPTPPQYTAMPQYMGPPQPQYSPQPQYAAPQPQYAAPQPQYAAPQPQYAAPQQPYTAPPQYAGPPQNLAPVQPPPAQYPAPNVPPAQAQYAALPPPPVQEQNPPAVPARPTIAAPPQFSYPAGPQNAQQAAVSPQNTAPQNPGPQNAGLPQFQYPAAPQPSSGNQPLMAARDSVPGSRPLAVPVATGDMLRRLPPVNEPTDPAVGNRDQQGPEVLAPNPPDWRR
jgi:tetratricopeptide (TPR) repeat protein